jgi:hypothetical protein
MLRLSFHSLYASLILASPHLPALSGDSQLTFSLFHLTILLSLYFLAIASLLLRLTYPPCPVTLSLLFHSFTPLFHSIFWLSPHFMLRLFLASPHLPALSGDSQLAFSLTLSLFSGYRLSLTISLSLYFLAIASLYASPDLPALSGHATPTLSLFPTIF